MLTFGITIPNFIVIFGIRISFVLRQSELTRDFHPLDNAHAVFITPADTLFPLLILPRSHAIVSLECL